MELTRNKQIERKIKEKRERPHACLFQALCEGWPPASDSEYVWHGLFTDLLKSWRWKEWTKKDSFLGTGELTVHPAISDDEEVSDDDDDDDDIADPDFVLTANDQDIPGPSDISPSAKRKRRQPAVEVLQDTSKSQWPGVAGGYWVKLMLRATGVSGNRVKNRSMTPSSKQLSVSYTEFSVTIQEEHSLGPHCRQSVAQMGNTFEVSPIEPYALNLVIYPLLVEGASELAAVQGSSRPTGTAGSALMTITADRSDTGRSEREEWEEIVRQRLELDRETQLDAYFDDIYKRKKEIADVTWFGANQNRKQEN
ncbi:hypothetical protein EYF80_011895 [Liparis tanakae]|uniref:Uncharacterized protein n=1 Tax=Liparis tanakae TaxID=230148 RepID=A0A4Z2IJ36_9TELE|nr:hypothetical protein EYF80_011895 [Liparis tanakae]